MLLVACANWGLAAVARSVLLAKDVRIKTLRVVQCAAIQFALPDCLPRERDK